MRLPLFRYRAPESLQEAARILRGEGPEAMLLAGGTDLLPNMKRRQQTPATLVALRRIGGLRAIRDAGGSGAAVGALVTISDLARSDLVARRYTALAQAAWQIATPHIRNMGTLGGNLCLDTRCNYYDQSYDWRKAIGFCLKRDGCVCWVATASRKCVAVSSTDTAPALAALGARVRLISGDGEREVAVTDLYQNDGIAYLRRRPDEIVSEVLLDPLDGWRSTYWKLRRRGSFDFPVLSVAAAARLSSGVVEEARIVLGAVASCPLEARAASALLAGRPLDRDAIEQAAREAARLAKPLDNTDFSMTWRKKVAAELVTLALRELRGDDVAEERRRLVRHALLPGNGGLA